MLIFEDISKYKTLFFFYEKRSFLSIPRIQMQLADAVTDMFTEGSSFIA